MKKTLKRFAADESGLELVEYAVMGALIVIAIIVAIEGLGSAIENKFNDLAGTIDPAS